MHIKETINAREKDQKHDDGGTTAAMRQQADVLHPSHGGMHILQADHQHTSNASKAKATKAKTKAEEEEDRQTSRGIAGVLARIEGHTHRKEPRPHKGKCHQTHASTQL